jgi:hypothetical protein
VSQYVYAPSYASGYGHALGAVSARGVTIDYYESPSKLTWSDRGMKKLHDGLVNADLSFQKTVRDVVRSMKPILGLLKLAGIDVKESDLDKLASNCALPSAGPAILLEVAFGGRKADSFFVGVMRRISQDLLYNAGLFGIVSAICLAVGSAGILAAGAGATLLAIAAPIGAAAVVCGIVGALLGNLAKGKMPSREEFGEMMKASAQLAGEPAPTEREIDLAYTATGAALAPLGVTQSRSAAFEAAIAAKEAAFERRKKQAIDEAKIKAKAQALQRALALRTKGIEDAKANAYSPPPPPPPESGPDYDLRLYQAGWVSTKPLPPNVTPAIEVATLKAASAGLPTSAENDEQGGFPVVPVAVAAGLALLFLVRR